MDLSKQYKQTINSLIRLVVHVEGSFNSVGSGVLIADGSYALTCAHCIISPQMICVQGNAEQGTVATVIFKDETIDIAILKFPEPIGPPAVLQVTEPKIGQECFSLGYPFYSHFDTILPGNIAGLELINNKLMMKIASPINHGNSGGPLFDIDGKLIGVVNTKLGEYTDYLNDFIDYKNNDFQITMMGIDPINTMQQLAYLLKQNMNVGVGTAVPLQYIAEKSLVFKEIWFK